MSALMEDMVELSRFGDDGEGVTRLAWTPVLEEALDWCAGRMRAAGLVVERDEAGNLIGRWETGRGRAVVAGSHLDTVPSGGRFDGALGVLAAIDAVRALRDAGYRPARPIWVAAFMDEEGVRFGTSMLGSRAFAGEPLDWPEARRDGDGVSLAEAIRALGREPAEIPAARRIGDVAAYLELHIEQGPTLERAGAEIGIVTAIAGMLGLEVTFTGSSRHAGTTPMKLRRDALVGAARLIGELRQAAHDAGDFVATVGVVRAWPGASNVVPGTATLSIDLRGADDAVLSRAEAAARSLVREVAAGEGLEAETRELYRNPPLRLDRDLIDVLEAAAREAGAEPLRLASGAGHDAMVIGRHVPAGMLFVPSRDGVSHSPQELTDDRLCELGAAVLAGALRRLTGEEKDDKKLGGR
jgi:hydantoinase/carbamoylase family amidase